METLFLFFSSACPHDILLQVNSKFVVRRHQTELKYLVQMWYEDDIKRSGDVMQQPNGLMAAQPLTTGRGHRV